MKRIALHDRKPLTAKQRVQLFFERKGECCICHGNISVKDKWIDEHIIPLAMGGTNDWSNRGCAHVACAKDKTKKDVGDIAKAKRIEARHIGAKQPKAKIPAAPFFKASKPKGHEAWVANMAAKGKRIPPPRFT
jgi:5-methylcytosine-specific restriction protein A